LSCDRWGEANLDWLIQNGKGNKPVTEARFRCQADGLLVRRVTTKAKRCSDAALWTSNVAGSGQIRQVLGE
ncbi:MAG: hypothetical protein V3S54_03125, partial [Woeseiaceae bacterium]